LNRESANGGTRGVLPAYAVAASVLLGLAVQVDLGRATPLALILLVAALAVLGWIVARLLLHPAGSLDASADPVRAALLLGLAANAVCRITASPGLYVGPWADALDHLRLVLVSAGLGLLCALGSPRLVRRAVFPALLLCEALLAVWMLQASPRPYIDVFAFHRTASREFLAGSNPYAAAMPNLYGDRAPVYPEGLAQGDVLKTGYPYPAPVLLSVAAADRVFGDPRFAMAVAWLGAAVILATFGTWGPALGAIWLSLPRGLFVLEQGWIDPLWFFGFVLVLAAVRARSAFVPWLFGWWIALKPEALPLAPLGALLVPEGKSRVQWWVAAAAAFLLPALPFLLADPGAYLASVFGYAARQVWRLESLSLLPLLTRHPPGVAVAGALAAFAVSLFAAVRFARGASGFAAGTAFALAAGLALGRSTGCAQWMLLAGVVLAGAPLLAGAGVRTREAGGVAALHWPRLARVSPWALLGFGLVAVAVVCGWGWLRQGPSDHELLANVSKASDLARGLAADGDFPWWTPWFNGGSSMASALGALLTYPWILVGMLFGGPFVGAKWVGLLQIPLAGLAMALLARRVTGCSWTAALAGLLYALAPQLAIALAVREHLVVAFALVWPPLILLALVHVRDRGTWTAAALLAAAVGAMGLTWIKSAAALMPFLGMAAFWLWWSAPDARHRFLVGLARAVLVAVPLLVFPLFPLVRETAFMTLFSVDPFEGWQRTFSLKSLGSIADRAGLLFAGMPGEFAVEEGRFYWGLVPLSVGLCALAWRPFRERLFGGPLGGWFRFAMLSAFVLAWLSAGPRSWIGGMLEYLGGAQGAANWTVPVVWLVFAAALLGLWHLLPCRSPWLRALALAAFLALPGFQGLEKLPGFGNLRAPWAIWEAGGGLCIALAGAIGCATLLGAVREPARRAVCGLGIVLVVLLDFSAYGRSFFRGELPEGTFRDFLQASAFLETAPRAGRVNAVSGRYFPLLIPALSGRGLLGEAFHGQFALRWQRLLERAAYESPESLRMQHTLSGVAYVLLDKKDPDTGTELQDFYRLAFPKVAFENDHFVLLENEGSLGLAFRATDYVSLMPGTFQRAGELISLARYGYLGVETGSGQPFPEGLAGSGDAGNGIRMNPAYKDRMGKPFEAVAGAGMANYRTFAVTASGRPEGWVVLTQAFHPDWRASCGGREVPAFLAAGGLLCARDPGGDDPLVFRFTPPAWYGWSLSVGALSWVGLAGWGLSGLLRARRGKPLAAPGSQASAEGSGVAQAGGEVRGAGVLHPLVVVPTYNEAGSLPGLLADVLAADPRIEVLVVDDASPDGTAGLVRTHPAYGQRVHLIERPGKLGLGTAYRDGFRWALARVYDACIEMDADLSHDPADLPRLIAALDEGADVAVGSRYAGGVRVVDWPLPRLLLSLGASRYVRLLTGLPLSDPTSGFKAIRRAVLERLDWGRFTSGGYSFQVEFHYFAWRAGFRLREVPIVFTERRRGASKMSHAIAVEAARRVIQLGVFGR